MNPNDTSRILDAVAADFIPANVNLLPQIAARFERKTFMQTLRARPALVILLVFLALSLLTGGVYALGRTFGYLPGVGLVEDGTQVRVLSEPVAQTRDGITLTVNEVILTSDKTVLGYQTSPIPPEMRPKSELGPSCNPNGPTGLRLPNGTMLTIIEGAGQANGQIFETRLTFGPIPAGVSIATFVLPCLMDVAPGKAPENWEIPLNFKPASPNLTVMPVIELATAPPATPTPPTAQTNLTLTSDRFLGITYHVDALTRTERGYLLQTSIQWGDDKLANIISTNAAQSVSLIDATGKTIPMVPVDITDVPGGMQPNHTYLTFSLPDEAFTAPLTLTLNWVRFDDLLEKPQFTFDPGANPQTGQSWPVNQKLTVAGLPVQIESAQFIPTEELLKQDWMRGNPRDMIGFNFFSTPDPALQKLSLTVKSGFSSDGNSTNGFSELDVTGKLTSAVALDGKIISPLTIETVAFQARHPWQVAFNPSEITTTVAAPVVTDNLNASIQIEKVIPIDDGYYLIGRTIWNDPRFMGLGFDDWATTAKLHAPDGTEIPLDVVGLDSIGISDYQADQWAYRVYGQVLPSTLILSMDKVAVQFSQPYTFTFDPGAAPKLGQEWQINQTLEILGHKAIVEKAVYIEEGDLHGFRFFVSADPELDNIPFSMESGMSDGAGSSGGGSTHRDENGLIKVTTLSDDPYTGPISLVLRGATLSGNWQATWNPPAAPAGAKPFESLQPCVTREKWKLAVASTSPIPAELSSSRVMLSRGALWPDPTLLITNLDGSSEQGLLFTGSGSLSPDASQLVYRDQADTISILDVASGQSKVTANAGYDLRWSPDGTKIAFRGQNEILIMDADGQNTHALPGSPQNLALIDWMPDSKKLIVLGAGAQRPIQLVDITNGVIETLNIVRIEPQSIDVAISPDQNWIAYGDKVPGKGYIPGIYISHLDGTEKRLLVQLDKWYASQVRWSSDGKWLAFLMSNGEDETNLEGTPALVNVESCQLVPLTKLLGPIAQWVK